MDLVAKNKVLWAIDQLDPHKPETNVAFQTLRTVIKTMPEYEIKVTGGSDSRWERSTAGGHTIYELPDL